MAGVKAFVTEAVALATTTHAVGVDGGSSAEAQCSALLSRHALYLGLYYAHPARSGSQRLSCCRVGLRPELSVVCSGPECSHKYCSVVLAATLIQQPHAHTRTFLPLHNPANTMSAPAAAAPKAVKPKAPKKPAAHPPTSEMVMKAIVTLKERSGSSLPAIKKYIAANYKVGPVGLGEKGTSADRAEGAVKRPGRTRVCVCEPQSQQWAGLVFRAAVGIVDRSSLNAASHCCCGCSCTHIHRA